MSKSYPQSWCLAVVTGYKWCAAGIYTGSDLVSYLCEWFTRLCLKYSKNAYSTIDSKDDCHILQKDLNNLSSWSRTWLLRFNAPKCVVLRIKQSIQYTYTLNGIVLETVANQKDLGVFFDDLTPGAHISHITQKCNQRIGLIKRCLTNLSADTVKILYQSLMRPVLEYGSPAWSPWYKKDITELEKVQSRCLKTSSDPISLPDLITRRQ